MKRARITCGGTWAKVCSRCASAFAGWSQRDAPTRTMRTSSFAGSGDCEVRSGDFLFRPCSAPVISAGFPGLRAVCRSLHPPAPIYRDLQGLLWRWRLPTPDLNYMPVGSHAIRCARQVFGGEPARLFAAGRDRSAAHPRVAHGDGVSAKAAPSARLLQFSAP